MKCIFTPKYAVACPFYDKESENCNFRGKEDCYFEEYIYDDSEESEEN